MRFFLFVAIITLISDDYTFGQSYLSEFGARSKGMANANTTIADEWSIFNNVAGISGVDDGLVFFGYDKYSGLEGFDKVAAGVIHPFKNGNIGFSLFNFGDDLYSESSASLAYGNKIGFVRLGAKLSYYQMQIDEFGTAGALFFDIGGIVELIPKLTFGAFISNFTLSKLQNAEKSELPVIMKAGFAYHPTDKVNINVDLYKDIQYSPLIKVGLEYVVVRNLYLRTGVNTNPFKSFFGIGLKLGRFHIDYAISNHDLLGFSHQANVSFKYFKRSEL